jgi:hypothetical protein
VAGGRLLARPERVKSPVHDRVGGRRHALDRDDRAEPEPFQRRQVEAAHPLGQVAQRVGAGVALVEVGVGQGSHPAGVEHDHGCTRHCRGF